MRKLFPFLFSLFLFIFLLGCSADSSDHPIEITIYPTPTTHKLFNDDDGKTPGGVITTTMTVVPTVASYFSEPIKPTLTPTPTELPIITPTPTAVQEMITSTEVLTVSIFDDALNTNWTAVPNGALSINLEAEEPVHNGNYSIGVLPGESFSSISFLVSEDSLESYLHNQIIGFRFWLNGGDQPILTSDLAITILGSNDNPYWVEGDNSVKSEISPVFSETRLYDFGINRTIPPNTWIQVNVPIHDLKYDPDYNYVVGFYIKNDQGVISEYFIDNIELFALPGGIVPSGFTPATSSGKIQ